MKAKVVFKKGLRLEDYYSHATRLGVETVGGVVSKQKTVVVDFQAFRGMMIEYSHVEILIETVQDFADLLGVGPVIYTNVKDKHIQLVTFPFPHCTVWNWIREASDSKQLEFSGSTKHFGAGYLETATHLVPILEDGDWVNLNAYEKHQ